MIQNWRNWECSPRGGLDNGKVGAWKTFQPHVWDFQSKDDTFLFFSLSTNSSWMLLYNTCNQAMAMDEFNLRAIFFGSIPMTKCSLQVTSSKPCQRQKRRLGRGAIGWSCTKHEPWSVCQRYQPKWEEKHRKTVFLSHFSYSMGPTTGPSVFFRVEKGGQDHFLRWSIGFLMSLQFHCISMSVSVYWVLVNAHCRCRRLPMIACSQSWKGCSRLGIVWLGAWIWATAVINSVIRHDTSKILQRL